MFLLLIILVWAVATPAAFGADEEIHVVHVIPAVVEQELGVEVRCGAVFSPRSLSTLQSGLSAVLRLELSLERTGQARTLTSGGSGDFEAVRETEMARSIAYDVWDEQYTVRGPGQVEIYAHLDSARLGLETFEQIRLATLSDLKPGTYRIRARVQLLPVSPEQGERIAAWLHGSGDSSEQTGPSGRRRAEFDVGDLFSMLWGRSSTARDRSAWASSEVFQVTAAAALEP